MLGRPSSELSRDTARPGQRPFRTRSDHDLATAFERALAAGDGVVGAHCIHERWMRGHFPAHIETALDLLWKRAGASIPDWLPMRYISWLPTAYEVAAQFTAKGERALEHLSHPAGLFRSARR